MKRSEQHVLLGFLRRAPILVVRTPLELAIVAGMVVLHGAISYLISWEVTREQKHDKDRGSAEEAEQDVLL